MSKPRVNYVLACYMGGRYSDDKRHIRDRRFFVRRHLEQLELVNHSLDQVTIVLAEGGDDEADAWAKEVSRVGDTPVTVLVRENLGLSYGSWNHAYEILKEDFDYSIVTEDDYMPAHDGFDQILVERAKKDGTYVTALQAGDGLYAGVSNGIIPHEVWRDVHPAAVDTGTPGTKGNRSQTVWSCHFKPKGHPISDWLDQYSTPYRRFPRLVFWYGHMSDAPLFVPLQVADQHMTIGHQGQHFVGHIDARGKVTPNTRQDGVVYESILALPREPIWRG